MQKDLKKKRTFKEKLSKRAASFINIDTILLQSLAESTSAVVFVVLFH